MHGINGAARLGFAAALLALLLAPFALSAGTANAQGPTVAQYYGTGLAAGDVVGAMVGDTECATATADASGNWLLQVGQDCASEGDTVNFTLNGAMAEETETWMRGGTPADAANGVTLTVSDDAGMDDDAGTGMTPDDKGDTGNAGLATSTGAASAASAAALALLALALTAAARRASARA